MAWLTLGPNGAPLSRSPACHLPDLPFLQEELHRGCISHSKLALSTLPLPFQLCRSGQAWSHLAGAQGRQCLPCCQASLTCARLELLPGGPSSNVHRQHRSLQAQLPLLALPDPSGPCNLQEVAPRRPGGGGREQRLPLQHFLRLIGGGAMLDRDDASNNEELVANLKKHGAITRCTVIEHPCMQWSLTCTKSFLGAVPGCSLSTSRQLYFKYVGVLAA